MRFGGPTKGNISQPGISSCAKQTLWMSLVPHPCPRAYTWPQLRGSQSHSQILCLLILPLPPPGPQPAVREPQSCFSRLLSRLRVLPEGFCSLESVVRNQTRWFLWQFLPRERQLQSRPWRRQDQVLGEETSWATPTWLAPSRPQSAT
jgi:hypothetical protein